MDDSAPYTMRERLRGVAISLTGLAVEFGWAVGESIMLPHMLAPPLSVAPAVAGLIFAINPVLSFGASPLVGAYVDGEPARARRRCATALFALGALVGMLALLSAPRAPRVVAVGILFGAFGWMDLCHDVMLIPGRALLIADLRRRGRASASAADDDGGGDALYSQVQLLGRLAGLVAITALPRRGALGCSYFEIAWLCSGTVLVACTSAALAATAARVPAPPWPPSEDAADAGAGALPAEVKLRRSLTARLLPLLAIQTVGWVGVMVFTMWCSVWLGLGTDALGLGLSLPLVAMGLHTLGGIMLAPGLARLNRSCGACRVWLGAQLLWLGALVAARWLGARRPEWTLLVCAAGGAQLLVHSANAPLLCRAAVDDERAIGWANALVQNAMPLAQVVVGAFAGLVVGTCPAAAADDDDGGDGGDGGGRGCPAVGRVLFFWTGAGGAACVLLVVVFDTCWIRSGLFARRDESRSGVPRADGLATYLLVQ